VYFFQKLYPFPRVNDTDSGLAAAAGGCMLVRREDLDAAGGIARIKDKVIDDCSLAAIIKPIRPIWLGLTEQTKSIRPYDDLASIWGMVARSAYVQLRFNPLLLLGTIVSMMLVYLLPVVAVVVGISAQDGTLFMLGATTWLIMWWTFLPTLDLYNKSAFWAVLLPLSGFLFTLMTIDSARQHYLGRGGAWKGRTYTKSNIS
jgi:hopene-associated glycosyltransferase HpnB